MTTALDVAMAYIARGWNPVPVRFRTKTPIGDDWQKRQIDAATAPYHFNAGPQNVGVLLGPTSQGLTDVDLDCVEAIAVAPYLLPPTRAIFGRPSKRASHWLYITNLADTTSTATINFDDPEAIRGKARLVELRIGGGGLEPKPSFRVRSTKRASQLRGKKPVSLPRSTAMSLRIESS
jgi:Bifunctional DNA primase/polymerase, N-terminal